MVVNLLPRNNELRVLKDKITNSHYYLFLLTPLHYRKNNHLKWKHFVINC